MTGDKLKFIGHSCAACQSNMSSDTSDAIVVLMTAANREEATQLAEMLVGARLAACVQVLPEIQSIYHWQGNIERQTETLLLAKSTKAKFDELEREVRSIHSYETPEILALPIVAGSDIYLRWLAASVNSSEELSQHAAEKS